MRHTVIALAIALLAAPAALAQNQPFPTVGFPLLLPGTGNEIDTSGNVLGNSFAPTGGSCSSSFNGLYWVSSNNYGFCVNGTQELLLNSSGLSAPSLSPTGSSAPSAGLFLITAGEVAVGISNNFIVGFTSNGINMNANGISNLGSNGITATSNSTLVLATNSQSAGSTAAGNVTITAGNATGSGGTSNGGSVVITSGTSTSGSAGTIQLVNLAVGTSALDYLCWNSSTHVVTADSAGTCLASRAELKNIVGPIKGALPELLALQTDWYSYKPDLGTDDLSVHGGFIAEQAESVDRRLVSFEPSGRVHSVRTLDSIPALTVAALQEENAKLDGFIAATAKTIAAQQREINELRHGNDNSLWHRLGVAVGFER